mmetsp:Transcript_19972/g.51841  ORF Transcript_19972/g.51841 Transcript_19972/m.51841 type:complete len:167 (+) Transcript_19972:61-561(+)|eukprot:CAMPEP_0182919470 /NCGR_PEP_ID=MMETSP0105_2-20130417/2753_1 /TAXON_ID=81532 ORGANISM="Acanthoeca-like sp., Strain 10tr" /NCGR_SAMPLE_ID=MMETSP0105_2 /ASSEMBLY_ACC=CAM_ASM_000205 /LENGTH=166 /DNA_ID=CAMNT_0025056669 /DNA_START=51 /DNA_END=551 /DNA_ORIENTATION=-
MSTTPIETVHLPARRVLGARIKHCPKEHLGKHCGEVLPRVSAHIAKVSKCAGPPLMRYHGMADGHFDIFIGIPAGPEVASAPDDGIVEETIPACEAITTVFTGKYASVGDGWMVLVAHAKENGLWGCDDGKWKGMGGWDEYINDPHEVGEDKAQTQLFLPIHKSEK